MLINWFNGQRKLIVEPRYYLINPEILFIIAKEGDVRCIIDAPLYNLSERNEQNEPMVGPVFVLQSRISLPKLVKLNYSESYWANLIVVRPGPQ